MLLAAWVVALKLEFHGTDTNTETDTDILARSPTSARGSSRGCRRVRRLPRSACHEPDTHDDPRRLVRRLDRHARFSSRGCPLGMRACSRVYTFTKLHDMRIVMSVSVSVWVSAPWNDVVICYVLPVMLMTSWFSIIGPVGARLLR